MKYEKLLLDGFDLPKELSNAITEYNEISENRSIKKLYYLQKINHYFREFMAKGHKAVIDWSHICVWSRQEDKTSDEVEESGFEHHLQRYGIHRDASELLQSIEFSEAVVHFGKPLYDTDKSFYQSLRDRDATFTATDKTEADKIKEYHENNASIWNFYLTDETLRTTILRQRNILILIYPKLEAIQELVQQNFEGFASKIMGSLPANNQNFNFTVENPFTMDEFFPKKQHQLVIRVEDRNSLGDDRLLQTYPVSEYFIEEYATVMVLFRDGQQETYLPVVISEYAPQGNLKTYAQSLYGKNDLEILKKTVDIFEQMSDFCLELKESGHYHPDIKLTNFLIHHDDQLRISDRKTIIDSERPIANTVCSTYDFSPPEYQQCFMNGNGGPVVKKVMERLTMEMNSFMSYQLGNVLKEFILESHNISYEKDKSAIRDKLLADLISKKKPNHNENNLLKLIQALTQKNPLKRLSILNFKALLEKTNCNEAEFLTELTKVCEIIEDIEVTPTISSVNWDANLSQTIRMADLTEAGELSSETDENTRSSFGDNRSSFGDKRASFEDKRASFIKCNTNRRNDKGDEVGVEMDPVILENFRKYLTKSEHKATQEPAVKISPAAIAAQVALGDIKAPSIFYSVVAFLVGGILGAVIGGLIPIIGTPIGILIIACACVGAALGYCLYHQVFKNSYKGGLSVPNHINANFNHSTSEPSKDCGLSNDMEAGSSYRSLFGVFGVSAKPSSSQDDLANKTHPLYKLLQTQWEAPESFSQAITPVQSFVSF